jgi:hypothetical protein
MAAVRVESMLESETKGCTAAWTVNRPSIVFKLAGDWVADARNANDRLDHPSTVDECVGSSMP